MDILITAYLFIVGLIFGSFALAMTDRMNANRDWVKGRSECEACHKKLQSKDLIPLLSWISTAGKCRYCGNKLSISYPLTELFTGLTFMISYIYWPYSLNTPLEIISLLIWLTSLVIISALIVFDLRWFKLPFKLVNPLIVLAVFWAIIDIFTQGLSAGIFINYVSAILVSAGLFQLLYSFSKGKWIGDGDIRLGIAIGLFAGSALESWLVIFIGSVIGVVFSFPSLIKIKSNKKRLKLKIPFGPPLMLALIITVLFGASLISWYKVNVLYL